MKECVFVHLALKIQCHVVKIHSYILTAFTAILPTGMTPDIENETVLRKKILIFIRGKDKQCATGQDLAMEQ